MRKIGYLLLIAMLLTACAPMPQAEFTPAPAITPARAAAAAPSPTPAFPPPTAEDFLNGLDVSIPLSEYMTQTAPVIEAQKTEGHAGIIAGREMLLQTAENLRAAIEAEAGATWGALTALAGLDGVTEADLSGLTWQYMAALTAMYGEDVVPSDFIEAEIDLHLNRGPLLRLSLKPCREAFESIADGDGNRYSTGRYLYAYLTTVYDDEGAEIDYVYPGVPEGYQDGVVFPLNCKTSRRNGWYNDRDKGKRKHTGMDLRAPEDEPILSCTNGVVIAIDENAGAGNYVLVLDDWGYEYHYYHMVRLTSFLTPGERVMAGDVIGHVGNTGNSDANHLHLTIVNPDGSYLNPYYMMKEVYPHK